MTETLTFLSNYETSFISAVDKNPRSYTTQTCNTVSPTLAQLHKREIPNINHRQNESFMLHATSQLFALRSSGVPVAHMHTYLVFPTPNLVSYHIHVHVKLRVFYVHSRQRIFAYRTNNPDATVVPWRGRNQRPNEDSTKLFSQQKLHIWKRIRDVTSRIQKRAPRHRHGTHRNRA